MLSFRRLITPSLTELLSSTWLLNLPAPAQPPARLAEVEEHIERMLWRAGRFMMRWGIIMILLWWPTDLRVFHRLPHALPAFFGIRATLLCTCAAVLLYLRQRDRVSPAAQAAPVALWCLSCAACAYFLGTLGGMEQPWFHFLYILVCVPIAFPIDLWRRALYTAVLSTGLLIGYAASARGTLASPFLAAAVGYLIFVVLAGILFGHLFNLLLRANLLQSSVLRDNMVQVASCNERLGAEVEVRSSELRQLSQHLSRALETERARISRDLHDELGQQISAMRYELVFLRQRFTPNPASIDKNLQTLEDLVARTAIGVQRVVAEMRPRVLDDLGLGAAAEWLVEQVGQRSGLRIELHIEGAPSADLPEETALTCFRVLQEALTNVLKHAAAHHVQVRLRFTEESVWLEVRDDGVGLAASAPPAGGMGLFGMRERARALGGSLFIEGQPGSGTAVRCQIPLAARRSA